MSKIKKLVLLLDLKWDDDEKESESFYVSDNKNLVYKISQEGLYFMELNGSRAWTCSNVNLFHLLNGEIIIQKLPYKPKNKGTYYISDITQTDLFLRSTCFDNDTKTDVWQYKCNLIYKTQEEAIKHSKDILKLLGVEV